MEGIENNSYVEAILEDSRHDTKPVYKESMNYNEPFNDGKYINDNADKHSANWTTTATSTLLNIYSTKLDMLKTPKKKTAMWIAISESLKDFNIEMTPNQVRWKINALTQKYKQCVDSGHSSFKYFKQLDNIYGPYYNEDSDTVTELLQKKRNAHRRVINENTQSFKLMPESRSMIELRKMRLASRIEADRSQSKIQIEKQWIEYLRRQEEHKLLKDDIFDRNLKLREESLELRKRELEMKETIEYQKFEIKERHQECMLQIEREKCELLRYVVANKMKNN